MIYVLHCVAYWVCSNNMDELWVKWVQMDPEGCCSCCSEIPKQTRYTTLCRKPYYHNL